MFIPSTNLLQFFFCKNLKCFRNCRWIVFHKKNLLIIYLIIKLLNLIYINFSKKSKTFLTFPLFGSFLQLFGTKNQVFTNFLSYLFRKNLVFLKKPSNKKNVISVKITFFYFDPSRIRTCDRSLRRRMLYPAEL